MVRPRMKLEKVEDEQEREQRFEYHKSIITTKVEELSALTGVDVMLLAFSPSGNPTLCLGQNSNLNAVVTKFSNRTRQEREMRKVENLQTLMTHCEKKGHKIDIDALQNAWMEKRSKDLHEELNDLKTELHGLNKKRRLLENPKDISNMEQMREIEESLAKSIVGLQKRKEHLNCEQTHYMHSSHYRDVDHSTCPSTSARNKGLEVQLKFQDQVQQASYHLSGFNQGFDLCQEDELMQQLEPVDQSYMAHLSEPQLDPTLMDDPPMD